MSESNQPVQAVAFDLDGLMFNTEEIYIDVAARLLGRRGHELDLRPIQQMMGRPAKTGLPIMIQWYGLADDVATLERETQEIFDQLLPECLAPLPGLPELLQLVDSLRLPKAIVTSSRRRYLQQILELAQLPTQFDFLLTAEDVQHGKPHPEIYLRAAARFGVEPAAMLVLEDSEHGCQSAVAAGAITVAVPGTHNAHAQYPPVDLRIDSLADPRLLARLRQGSGR
jgi:HAD superfamily hydrolase (TIGR01509 family)